MQDAMFTKVVHAGEEPQANMGSLNTPVYNTSVFAFSDAEQGSAIHEGQRPGYFYGRMGNPTQAALEKAMSELERGEAALAFASGMAAISTTLLTVLQSGDHIVAPQSLYATTGAFFDQMLRPFGIEVTYVDGCVAENFAAAVRPQTKLFYLETPANPTLALIDIRSVCEMAKKHKILTIVDNTFATPFNQQPLTLGADAVVHSATKYLGGHGDLLAGILIGSTELVEGVRWKAHKMLGGVIAPQTAWLVLRGIKTLALRMERHNSNATAVARFLEAHPKVRSVHYPGLISHPQHDLAKVQMYGHGGVIAFDVSTIENGRNLVNSVRLCSLAVSLGDVASLIQHSASMTHASVPAERRRQAGITDGLLRLSVGIESVQDIIQDLDRALASVETN